MGLEAGLSEVMISHSPEARQEWYSKYLFDPISWYPERLGPSKTIFSVASKYPATSFFLDPSPVASLAAPLGGRRNSEVLFEVLGSLAEGDDVGIFYLTSPDGAVMMQHWDTPFDRRFWTPGLLATFENIPSDQDGGRFLALVFFALKSVVIFDGYHGLNVSFHGDHSLWEELVERLQGAGFPVGWTFSDA